MQSVLKFSDVLFALKSDVPPIDEALGQVDFFASLWFRLTFGEMYPQVEESSGQV